MPAFAVQLVLDPAVTPADADEAIRWQRDLTVRVDGTGRVVVLVYLDASRLELAASRVATEALLWQLPVVHVEAMLRVDWEARESEQERLP